VLVLTASFLISLLTTSLMVRSVKVHGHRSGDRDFTKPQKFHVVAVPRIGGLGIVLGLLAALGTLLMVDSEETMRYLLELLICATPAFVAGFVQDFTEAITPKGRLLATALSALMAFMLINASIRVTDVPGLDWLVTFTAGSLFLTVFTVAGLANAINIIDGFNGLASMCVIIMLTAVAYVAFQVGDRSIALMALAGIGAILGFFVWNFPAGLIFLGDGGAYFLGFYLAELSILLIQRNPRVSPMFALLLGIYPVFETLFSVYRRRVLRGRPVGMPDGAHLHSLIYRRFLRWAAGERTARELTRRNSMTSPYLWLLSTMSAIPSVLWWHNSRVLQAFIMVFAMTYLWLYWRIVRFRSPRWMLLRR